MLAQRYKRILARSGVELRLMPSTGAVENLKRLNDRSAGVNVGFVQGGLTSEDQSPDLVSLGTLFYEPLWVFYRGSHPGARLERFRGTRISVGPEGSGTRALAMQLLALNDIDKSNAQLLPLSIPQAGNALLRGEIDAAIIVTSWDTPLVRQLLASSEIHLHNFERADAYVALYPFLTKLMLPEGVGNMVTNLPPTEVPLFAVEASLIVRRDLHPALQYLLLDAATDVHSLPGIFHRPGRFPAPEEVDLPLSKTAQQFYKSGRPFLQRYLPFWLAVLAGQLLLLLIPVVAVAYPLLRVAPALYGWGMRRRIFRLYGELKFIEAELEAGSIATRDAVLARLDRLEQRANHLWVPAAFAPFLYQLRNHIDLVRAQQLRAQESK
jgi:TRAP-type uncharacterized transport system substrate-binding protein